MVFTIYYGSQGAVVQTHAEETCIANQIKLAFLNQEQFNT